MIIEVRVCPTGCGHYYGAPSVEDADLAQSPRMLKVENQKNVGRTMEERIENAVKDRGHRGHCPRCILGGDRVEMEVYHFHVPLVTEQEETPRGLHNVLVKTGEWPRKLTEGHYHPILGSRSVVEVDVLKDALAEGDLDKVGMLLGFTE